LLLHEFVQGTPVTRSEGDIVRLRSLPRILMGLVETDRFRIRAFALSLILVAGCVSAALLHVLMQWELGRGSGPDPYHGYAHILVLPLLCGGTAGTVFLALWRAISNGKASAGRRAPFAMAEAFAGQPFVLASTSISLCAFGTLELCEYVEQLVSFGCYKQALPVHCSFIVQLVLIAAFVTLLLNALLHLCFHAVEAVAALLAFRSSRMPACANTGFRRSDETPQAIIQLLADSIGRRGPPELQPV
jgi:hypothetical protein